MRGWYNGWKRVRGWGTLPSSPLIKSSPGSPAEDTVVSGDQKKSCSYRRDLAGVRRRVGLLEDKEGCRSNGSFQADEEKAGVEARVPTGGNYSGYPRGTGQVPGAHGNGGSHRNLQSDLISPEFEFAANTNVGERRQRGTCWAYRTRRKKESIYIALKKDG